MSNACQESACFSVVCEAGLLSQHLLLSLTTGSAVCSISIGKWQISTAQGAKTPELIWTRLGMVDYVRDSTPHDYLGRVSATWVVWANMWLFTFLEILFFFCFFFSMRSHFLTNRNDLYAKTSVFGQGCAFWGSRQYLTTFKGSNPQKPPQNGPQ